MKKHFFIFFLLLINGISFAQNIELIQVKGMTINLKMEPVPFAHILIKSRHTGTISNADGKFDLFTRKGDTLEISCVGYKKSKYYIPSATDLRIYHFLAILNPDTLHLPEVNVFPWKNYNEFVNAFVKTKIPDDDIDKAQKNFELIQIQMVLNEDEIPPAAGAAYNLSMIQRSEALYWKGQTQPMQIFNVFAWAQFFDYLKNGKFKYRNKKKEYKR
jgi:hypothetical protein